MNSNQRVLIALLSLLTLCTPTFAQRGAGQQGLQSSRGNILFGDVTVEGADKINEGPQTFLVTLKTTTGITVNRDSIPANGRFRFLRVPNGEYYLIVTAGEQEVYRERLNLVALKPTEIRKDVALVWQGSDAVGISADVTYARSDENQQRMDGALGAISRGELQEAVLGLEQLLKDDPDDYEAWTELGTCHFKREKYKDAEKAYLKAIEAKPRYLLALINVGKVRLARKDYAGAATVLAEAAADQPERADVNHLIGEAYLGMKKGSTAVGYLNKALSIDPDGMADVHLRLAQLYNAAGYKELAAKEYQQYLKKRPDSPRRDQLEKYIKENSGS